MIVARLGDQRTALKNHLKDEGHVVHEIDDGGSALELIRVIKPAVAIIDIDLPNLDGLSVLKAVRASSVPRGLPVILTGASERAAVRSTANTLNVVDYLIRPFQPEEIALRVSWALKGATNTPAVPWGQTDVLLRQIAAADVTKSEAPPETTPAIVAAYENLIAKANALPGAAISMMTPEKGGTVETKDGIVRVDVPPGSVRRPMSLGAARPGTPEPPLEETVRIRMGRRVADLTFVDQTGSPIGGPKLDRPVKISIKYDERDIVEAGSPDALSLQRYRPESDDWEEISYTLDPKERRSIAWERNFSVTRRMLGGKVLIAEGVGEGQIYLADTVEGAGFVVLLEPDGLAVTSKVLAERPDVVLVDLALPRLDGIQVLRQIKGDPATRSTPVILFGESQDQNLQASLMTMGVRELILKPWQAGDVQRRVRRAYHASRATRSQQERAVERVRARHIRQVRQAAHRADRAS
jgi:DNA-binding response OmpR family regulator